MSINNAITFYTQLSSDSELQEKLGAGTGDRFELGAKASEIGKEMGLEFSTAEFMATHEVARTHETENDYELSEAELETIAGGGWAWTCTNHTGWGTCGFGFVDLSLQMDMKSLVNQVGMMAETMSNSRTYTTRTRQK